MGPLISSLYFLRPGPEGLQIEYCRRTLKATELVALEIWQEAHGLLEAVAVYNPLIKAWIPYSGMQRCTSIADNMINL